MAIAETNFTRVHLGRPESETSLSRVAFPAVATRRPSGAGIQRAAMPDLLLPGDSTDVLHHIMGCAVRLLVDEKQTVVHVSRPSACWSSSTTCWRTVSKASRPPKKPAAFRCPPPPLRRAIFSTSTSPRLRKETLNWSLANLTNQTQRPGRRRWSEDSRSVLPCRQKWHWLDQTSQKWR